MRKSCFTFLIVLVLAVGSRAARAQQEHPNRATGERGETLYAQAGQDEVNLFNGNLMYRIPIGEGVQAGPRIRLAPVLVFNSTPLRNWNLGCSPPPGTRVTESYPAGDRIFSHGWQLHFGRVVPVNAVELQALVGACTLGPSQAPGGGEATTQSPVVTMISTGWGYQDPDGAVHEFFDRQTENVPPAKNCWTGGRSSGEHCFVYTHDGSFLRMDPKDPEYGGGTKPVVYFPDGTRRVMGFRAGRTRQDNTQGPREDLFYADIAPDFAPGNFQPPAFHTTEIADPFGNKVNVNYYGDGVAPPHPLNAYGVPQNQWDAIPYRAYADSYPSASYTFDTVVGAYSPIVGGPIVFIPFVSVIHAPASSGGSVSYSFFAAYQTGGGGPQDATIKIPVLQTLTLPTGLTYNFTHALSGQPEFLTRVTLPTSGQLEYDYDDFKLPTKQPNEYCTGTPSDCYMYAWDTVTGVAKRRAKRNVRTTPGGTSSLETAETTYIRSYLVDNACDSSHPQNCQMRVDQWTPFGLASSWNVTRTTFFESDGYTNTPTYGRPFQVDEFFVPTSAAPSPSQATIDAIASTPVRRTLISYDHDGLHLNPPVQNPDGHSHNTRETCRQIIWCGGAACAGTGAGCDPTPNQRYWQVQRFGWDGYGHFAKVVTSEATNGSNLATLRSVIETHLNRDVQSATALWILDPVTARTTSTDASDTPPPTSGSREVFNVDQSTGFVRNRTVTADDPGDSRIHYTTWTPGAYQNQYCRYGGPAGMHCNNRGFVQSETVQLVRSRTFGSVAEPSSETSFTRNFYYQYGVLSAWFDSYTTFYGLDNDLSVCGKPLSTRGPEGRTSVTDTSPHSTTFEYDGLGRVTKRTPYGEWPETTSYTAQTALTRRCGDAGCNAFIDYSKTYLDELGRATISLKSMPGANNWSYGVTTYDTAGRTVSSSARQAITCSEADPCSTGSSNLLNLQASISGSGSTSTVNIPGTIRTSFGMLGIPQYTISPDGSLATSSFPGWWQVQTTRKVNQAPTTDATYTYNRDALGRLTSVVEPATVQPDTSACMNGADTTSYTYDAFDRLIQAVKVGTDASCTNQTTQTRTWNYDDFGWLVSEQTPEVPNYEVRQRDGRGNVIAECTGPTATCGPTPADHSTQDRISHCYDGASRLLSSTRAYDLATSPRQAGGYQQEVNHCNPALSTTASFEDFYYESYSYPGVNLNFGRSNGRLVYGVRHNLGATQHGTSNLGWFLTEDLYQYGGLGDRLNQRQMSTFVVGGLPSTLSRVALDAAPAKTSFSASLANYFTGANRRLKKHDDGLATALATVATATPAPAVRLALNANNPNGWFRWFWYYDNAGRPYLTYYPRRDEPDRTSVVSAFDRGWLTSASATLVDPFNPGAPTQVSASLTYAPSGTQSQVTLSASPGGQVYSLRTPDDGSMGRIGQWLLDRANGIGFEYRGYAYDGSGNVTATNTATFAYDTRSRLVKFVENSTQKRRFDSFGNLWQIDDSLSGIQNFSPEMATNRHIATGSGVPAAFDGARGNLIFDATQSRNVGRDYYADGRPMTEYGRTSSSYATVYPVGISIYLDDVKGERAMTFHGDGINCDSELIRQSIRDESGRLMTDYKADNQGACNCSTPCIWTDRFERDYVWLGSYTQLSIKRGDTTPHFTALDHLGSPRHQFDRWGGPIGIDVLDAWGNQLSVSQPERTRFTGHERNNVDLDGPYLPISDYLHTRTYVPMLGRFTSPDVTRTFSLFRPGDMNRYLYGNANPSTYVDRDGRFAIVFPLAPVVGGLAAYAVITDLTNPSRGGRSAILDTARSAGRLVKDTLGALLTHEASRELSAHASTISDRWKDWQDSVSSQDGRWVKVGEQAEPATGKKQKGGTSIVEKWKNVDSGEEIEIHKVNKGDKTTHGPHPREPKPSEKEPRDPEVDPKDPEVDPK